MISTKQLLISTVLSVLALGSSVTMADEKSGEALFNTNCAACHGAAGGMDTGKRLAPPVIAIKKHYIGTYSDKDSFVDAIVNWVEQPEESQSMMRGAIKKFKIMPKLNVPAEDVEKIAAYIFQGELNKPEGFDEHVAKRHGKNYMDGVSPKEGMGHEKKHKKNTHE